MNVRGLDRKAAQPLEWSGLWDRSAAGLDRSPSSIEVTVLMVSRSAFGWSLALAARPRVPKGWARSGEGRGWPPPPSRCSVPTTNAVAFAGGTPHSRCFHGANIS